ncbi:MAG: HIT domain-containing protein [Actinobacteria bacterium]|nr:MAG: HIT domain-containing protein [Actinomycetota bacterium]
MENIWAPWRMKYINKEHKDYGKCIFCEKLADDKDSENLILHRAKFSFIIMNLYPYISGHLMVLPNKHTSDFISLTENESIEINAMLKKSIKALEKAISPHAFNIGLNLGRQAGAGIAEHIHWHIVPRWEADTNFMPIINDARIVPQSLEDTYQLLKKAIDD